MKAKDSVTLGVLRNIKAKITDTEKSGTDASDEVVQKIVEKKYSSCTIHYRHNNYCN